MIQKIYISMKFSLKEFKNFTVEMVDFISKLATALGVAFGAYAYFHTIHPIFEKEIELRNANKNLNELKHEINITKNNLSNLENEKKSYEKTILTLDSIKNNLEINLSKSQEDLLKTQESLEVSSHAASLNIIKNFSQEIFHKYLLSVTSGKDESFDALDFSRKLLDERFKDKKEEYEHIAYIYLKSQIDKNHKKISKI